MLNKTLQYFKENVKKSDSLTEDAKHHLTSWVQYIEENKSFLLRVHQSLFYINGTFYNIANRMTGIKYVS